MSDYEISTDTNEVVDLYSWTRWGVQVDSPCSRTCMGFGVKTQTLERQRCFHSNCTYEKKTKTHLCYSFEECPGFDPERNEFPLVVGLYVMLALLFFIGIYAYMRFIEMEHEARLSSKVRAFKNRIKLSFLTRFRRRPDTKGEIVSEDNLGYVTDQKTDEDEKGAGFSFMKFSLRGKDQADVENGPALKRADLQKGPDVQAGERDNEPHRVPSILETLYAKGHGVLPGHAEEHAENVQKGPDQKAHEYHEVQKGQQAYRPFSLFGRGHEAQGSEDTEKHHEDQKGHEAEKGQHADKRFSALGSIRGTGQEAQDIEKHLEAEKTPQAGRRFSLLEGIFGRGQEVQESNETEKHEDQKSHDTNKGLQEKRHTAPEGAAGKGVEVHDAGKHHEDRKGHEVDKAHHSDRGQSVLKALHIKSHDAEKNPEKGHKFLKGLHKDDHEGREGHKDHTSWNPLHRKGRDSRKDDEAQKAREDDKTKSTQPTQPSTSGDRKRSDSSLDSAGKNKLREHVTVLELWSDEEDDEDEDD